jgi:biopolymer transport protein ExbB
MQRFWELILLGGPVMFVLAAASLVGLTIVFERLMSLQRHKVIPPRFVYVLRQMLGEGRLDDARQLCASNDSAIAAVVLAGIKQVQAGRSVIREAMQDRGRRESVDLERFIGALGAIVTVSPLLGLLGTITGMISTFQGVTASVADGGAVNAGSLAGGIWEALLTTAAGLTVAIPAFVAYRLLLARVDSLVGDLEEVSLDFGEQLATLPAHVVAAASAAAAAPATPPAGDAA